MREVVIHRKEGGKSGETWEIRDSNDHAIGEIAVGVHGAITRGIRIDLERKGKLQGIYVPVEQGVQWYTVRIDPPFYVKGGDSCWVTVDTDAASYDCEITAEYCTIREKPFWQRLQDM